MSENKGNKNNTADNEKHIDDIINSSYISDLCKKYEVAEENYAESERSAGEQAGFMQTIKEFLSQKNGQTGEETTISKDPQKDENTVDNDIDSLLNNMDNLRSQYPDAFSAPVRSADKITSPENANSSGADELSSYLAETSSELEIEKNEITTESGKDEEPAAKSTDISVQEESSSETNSDVTEPVAAQDNIFAPADFLPTAPAEAKQTETNPVLPSMRIIYQASEGKNPGFSASQYPAAQVYSDYSQQATPLPVEQKVNPASTVQDYLANMRVIYEAPEASFADNNINTVQEETDTIESLINNSLASGENREDTAQYNGSPSQQKSLEPSPVQQDEFTPANNSLADLFADNKEKNEKKTVKRFIKNIFPAKGDGLWESVRKIVLIASIITMFVCGGILLNMYVVSPYLSSQQSQKAVDSKVNSSRTKNWFSAKDKYANVNFPKGMQLKYADLFVENKDFAGWLEIPGAGVDMPVVKGKDNEVYLKKTFYGEKSKYGCVFADFRNTIDTLNRNTILYGHNMSYNDLMFGKLEAYRNIDTFKASPVIKFNTLYNDYEWKIYAVIITNSEPQDDNGYVFNYIFTELSSDTAFQSYIKAIDQRKLYTTGVDILPSDKILTLSTCCYDFDDARFVVIARMVRKGESGNVDVSKASVNGSPRYPQAWYSAKGRNNPFSGAEKWIPS